MKAEKIPALEANFDKTGTDNQGKKHLITKESIPFANNTEKLDYTRLKLADGDKSFYFEEKYPKDQIVIHYTVGYLPGDVGTLTTKDDHVSVPFLIGRNGNIYNIFPSTCWSYHLGKNALGGNEARSKRSVGIELSNIGPLILKNNELYTSYKDKTGQYFDVYCSVNDKELYTKQLYRNFEYYATFTREQYDALVILLRFLTAKYNIPREFMSLPSRFETTQMAVSFKGIVTHVNYRTDKYDIGPAFDWDYVIQKVKA